MIDKERKAEIARANSKKSTGPVTPEGKERCSKNGLVHGKYAKKHGKFVPRSSTLLSNEDRNEFIRIFRTLTEQFGPQSEAEYDCIHRIADADWRQNRWELIETFLLESEFDRLPESLPERFQYLAGAAEILIAARNLQSHSADSRLFTQVRHQQFHYHRLRKELINQFIKVRKHFPPQSLRPNSSGPDLL